MTSQADAITWVNGGWKSSPYVATYSNGTGIDVDHQFGFQCADWRYGYTAFLGKIIGGNAIDAWYANLGPTYQKIPAGSNPQPGDIHVYGPPYGYDSSTGKYYGHTGIVVGGNATSFQTVDQNWINASLTVGSPPTLVTHNISGLLGFIRPQFNGGEEMINDGDLNYISQITGVLEKDLANMGIVGRTWKDGIHLVTSQPIYVDHGLPAQVNLLANERDNQLYPYVNATCDALGIPRKVDSKATVDAINKLKGDGAVLKPGKYVVQ